MSILSNLYVILALRLAHIGGGVIWVGSAILAMLVLLPAVRSSEAAGQKFMQNFGPRFGRLMGIATTLTVLSGALLYARFFSAGFGWVLQTDVGRAFTVGAVAALASYVMGARVFGQLQGKIQALGAAMEAAGGPPGPAQLAEMSRLQASLIKAYRVDMVLLLVAMGAMAVARYL